MKKALSFVAVAGIFLSSSTFVSAQKLRPQTEKKTQRAEAISDKKLKGMKPVNTEFGPVKAKSGGNGVLLKWDMVSESGNLGFRVYRMERGGRVLANSQLVFGSFAKAGSYPLFQESYSFFDKAGRVGSVYEIESQDTANRMARSSVVVSVYGKVPDDAGNDPTSGGVDSASSSSRVNAQDVELPKEVLDESVSLTGESDPDTHKWVMSQGGVRIDVKKEGIYRVPFADLQTAGFNTAADPANWQLYCRGIQIAIRVVVPENYIEFYGKGVDTPETDRQGYFLINGPSFGKRMANSVVRPTNSTVLQHGYSTRRVYKERTFHIPTLMNGEAENFFGRTIDPVGTTINFDLVGVNTANPTAGITIRLQGYSLTEHQVRVTLNGQELGIMEGNIQFAFNNNFQFPSALLRDSSLGQGQNELNLTSIAGGTDNSLFDMYELDLSRRFVAESGSLKAYTLNSKIARIRGFGSSSVRAFDVTNEADPKILTNIAFQSIDGSFGVNLPAARPRIILAIADTAVLAPAAISSFDNEVLGVTSHSAELVVITYKGFRAQADAWAAYRIAQGTQSKVVNVEEIMNEFNFGVNEPLAIRSFLQYADINWQSDLNYVLLIGDATDDPRDYQNTLFPNFVPSKVVTTTFGETGSDEALADFNNDGLAEIAVGRIAANTASRVTDVFNKTVNWETNLLANPLARGALFAYDVPNGYPFRQMSERLRDELGPGVTSTMVGRGLNPPANEFEIDTTAQSRIVNGLNEGKYVVNYSGHGSAGLWASPSFFGSATLPQLTSTNNEAMFTMLTCLNGAFLNPRALSLAERLVLATNGGGVSAWASTGLTTPDVQEVMALRFYSQLGQGNIQRLGDLIIDAKTVIEGGSDVRLSWVLLGDPMLKVN